jgi:hypothetical protein
MVQLDMATMPRRHFLVRFRRTAGVEYLIRGTDVYKLTPLSSSVWHLCDGTRTLFEIWSAAMEEGSEKSDQLLEQVIATLRYFHEHDLLDELANNDELVLEDEAWAGLLWLMEQCQGPDTPPPQCPPSYAAIQRFYQIVLEALQRNQDGWRSLMSLVEYLLREPRDVAVALLQRGADITDWRWRADENKLVLHYADSVYVGDVDHRL